MKINQLADGTILYRCPCGDSFVVDGMVQFLGDCSHALAGKTVPLGEWAR